MAFIALVRDRKGADSRVEVRAETQADAAKKLNDKGFRVLKIEAKPEQPPPPPPPPPPAAKSDPAPDPDPPNVALVDEALITRYAIAIISHPKIRRRLINIIIHGAGTGTVIGVIIGGFVLMVLLSSCMGMAAVSRH